MLLWNLAEGNWQSGDDVWAWDRRNGTNLRSQWDGVWLRCSSTGDVQLDVCIRDGKVTGTVARRRTERDVAV